MFPWISEVAIGLFFDNSSNGFTATDVQSAIEEARSVAIGRIRIPDVASYNGPASNKWLERSFGLTSDTSPLIITEDRQLVEIAITVTSASTGTVTVYKNPRGTPVSIASISLSNATAARTTLTNILLIAGDEIGYLVSSGTLTRPAITVEFQQLL